MPLGMSKQASDTLEQGFRKTYEGVDNSFKTVLLRDGAKFHQAQFTPEQAQMVPVRKELVKEIARFFNLPPHKLGDDSKSSYNSLEQENRSYLDSSLSIWLNTIASEVWLKLLTTDEQKEQTHFAEHNVPNAQRRRRQLRGAGGGDARGRRSVHGARAGQADVRPGGAHR